MPLYLFIAIFFVLSSKVQARCKQGDRIPVVEEISKSTTNGN